MKTLTIKTFLVLIIIIISPFKVCADYSYDWGKEGVAATRVGLAGYLQGEMQGQYKAIKLAQGNFRSTTFDPHPLPDQNFYYSKNREIEEKR